MASTVDPTLDRADRHAADRGGFFVTESFRRYQEKGFTLFVREFGQSCLKVLEIKVSALRRRGREPSGHDAVRVFDLAPSLPVSRVELVAQDGESQALMLVPGANLS